MFCLCRPKHVDSLQSHQCGCVWRNYDWLLWRSYKHSGMSCIKLQPNLLTGVLLKSLYLFCWLKKSSAFLQNHEVRYPVRKVYFWSQHDLNESSKHSPAKIIHSFVHSLRSLSYDRSINTCNASFSQSATCCFLFHVPESSLYLYLYHQLLSSSSSSSLSFFQNMLYKSIPTQGVTKAASASSFCCMKNNKTHFNIIFQSTHLDLQFTFLDYNFARIYLAYRT